MSPSEEELKSGPPRAVVEPELGPVLVEASPVPEWAQWAPEASLGEVSPRPRASPFRLLSGRVRRRRAHYPDRVR